MEKHSMPKAYYSQFRLTGTWWVFFVNLILLLVNVCVFVVNSKWLLATHKLDAQASHVAKHIGMDAAYSNGPISVFVSKDFPRKNDYKVFDHSQLMILSIDDADQKNHNQATRKAAMTIGTDYQLACYYSVDDGIRIHELTLTTNDKLFVDMNADGQYDLIVSFSAEGSSDHHSQIQIWYNRQWRDVTSDGVWGVYRRTLRDGGVVEFDEKSGRWRSARGEK